MREAADEIEAVALVPAAPEEVFEFLCDLGNHWRLLDRHVDVLELNGDSAVVRLRGPIGVRRVVHTRVTAARAPQLLIGVAELGSQTRALVSWTLAAHFAETRVRLAAEVEHASGFDRVVLAGGGRIWLRRRFAFGLERLADRFASRQPTPRRSPRPGERSARPTPSQPGPAYPSAGGSS